jgi:hypothetical protein
MSSVPTPEGAPPEPGAPPAKEFRSRLVYLLGFLLFLAGVLLAYGRLSQRLFGLGEKPFGYLSYPDLAILFGIFSLAALGWLWFFRQRRSNGATALFILANMGALATAAVFSAVLTEQERRAHDTAPPHHAKPWPRPVEELDLGKVTPVAPFRLAALGYLPADTNVIVGVHLAEALQSEAGKRLLHDPIQVGTVEIRPADVEKWTGLKLEEVDHFVLSVSPRLILVVRTRRAFDPDKVRAALTEGQGLPFKPALRLPDKHTIVLGVVDGQLDTVPALPRTGSDHLPEEVRTALQKRLPPAGPFWAVGAADDWSKTSLSMTFARLKKEDCDRLERVCAFAVGLDLGEKIRVNAALKGKDEAAAEALEKFFTGLGQGVDLTMVRDGQWLTLQLTTDLNAVGRALRKEW